MWLIAAAIAVVLFLINKTPTSTIICLLALTVLLMHPVTQVPWIRNKRKRQFFAIVVLIAFIIFFGFHVWPTQDNDRQNRLGALIKESEAVISRISKNMWIRRCTWIAVGFSLSWLFGRVKRVLSFYRRLGGSRLKAKGFLDYKLQAEEGMRAFSPVLGRITKITTATGNYFVTASIQLQKLTSSPARVQLQYVEKVARKLYKLSKELDDESIRLKEISDSSIEGINGWMKWMSFQKNKEAAAQNLRSPIDRFVQTMSITVPLLDQFMITVDSMHGVSQALNHAVDAQLASVKRVRDITESLRASCAESLRILQPS